MFYKHGQLLRVLHKRSERWIVLVSWYAKRGGRRAEYKVGRRKEKEKQPCYRRTAEQP